MILHACRLLAVMSLTAMLAGCESSEFDVAKASGKVVCGDEPVTMGSVTFTPVGEGGEVGKPAIGRVEPDGSFVLSTYGEYDGAILGKHRVLYSPPENFEEEEADPVDENSPEAAQQHADRMAKAAVTRKLANCGLKEELIVDVVAGKENTFTIELTPGAGGVSEDE